MADAYQRMGGKGGAGDGMKTASTATVDIEREWALVKSDAAGSPSWLWCIFNTESNAYDVLASGSGGLEAMEAASDPKAIQFGGVRVEIPGKPRFVHILYVGPEVSAVKKGKALLLKSAAFNAMTGASGEIAISHARELKEKLEELTGCSDVD